MANSNIPRENLLEKKKEVSLQSFPDLKPRKFDNGCSEQNERKITCMSLPYRMAIFSRNRSIMSLALNPSHLPSPSNANDLVNKMDKNTEWISSQKVAGLQIIATWDSKQNFRDRRSWKLLKIFTCAVYWGQIAVRWGCWPPFWAAHILFYDCFFILFALRWQFWLWEAIFPPFWQNGSCDVTCDIYDNLCESHNFSTTLLSSPGKALKNSTEILFPWLNFYYGIFYFR